jgi:hypothetical protein
VECVGRVTVALGALGALVPTAFVAVTVMV